MKIFNRNQEQEPETEVSLAAQTRLDFVRREQFGDKFTRGAVSRGSIVIPDMGGAVYMPDFDRESYRRSLHSLLETMRAKQDTESNLGQTVVQECLEQNPIL